MAQSSSPESGPSPEPASADVAGGRPEPGWDLVIRPQKSARIASVLAISVVLIFFVIAAFLPDEQAGVSFTGADQWGMAGIGILIAAGILSFTRPRVRVGPAGVETRGFFASPRLVEWSLIRSVDFVPKTRFARLVLPADEAITLYAVQRGDRERTVAVMQQIRALHARWRSS